MAHDSGQTLSEVLPLVETRASAPVRVRAAERIARQLSPARLSGVYLFGVFVVVFALWVPDTFLTSTTAKAIAGDQAITAILALGALCPLVVGAFDLSMAQNLGLSAVVAGALMSQSGLDPALAIAIVLVMGLTIGVVNGWLVAYVGVNSFIATLGTSSVLLAFSEIVSKYQYVGPVPAEYTDLVSGQPFGIPSVTLYMLVAALLAWYAIEHTPLGRRMHATGAGAEAARLAGISTQRHTFGAFVASGVVASLAGLLLLGKIGQVSSSVGAPYLLPMFAACFLGTTQLKPGRFNVWGTVLALYLLATGVTGLQLAGGSLWITDMFNGVALVLAVAVAVVLEKRRAASRRRAAAAR
jgi:ribose transport system permease protein